MSQVWNTDAARGMSGMRIPRKSTESKKETHREITVFVCVIEHKRTENGGQYIMSVDIRKEGGFAGKRRQGLIHWRLFSLLSGYDGRYVTQGTVLCVNRIFLQSQSSSRSVC